MINGFQKLSLIDYPNNVCAVVFTGGCTFKCPFCHNPELVYNIADTSYSEENIITELSRRTKLLDGVCITGGEPTIHNELKGFIKKIKNLGLKVKLDTNGTNPGMLNELINEKLIDYIAMDIKTALERYSTGTGVKTDIQQIRESIKIITRSGIDHEFRTTMVPGVVNNEDVEEIIKEIKGAKKYVLQQFRPQKTLNKEFQKIKPYSQKYIEQTAQKIINIKTEIRV